MFKTNICPKCKQAKPPRYAGSRICLECSLAAYDAKHPGAKERRKAREEVRRLKDRYAPLIAVLRAVLRAKGVLRPCRKCGGERERGKNGRIFCRSCKQEYERKYKDGFYLGRAARREKRAQERPAKQAAQQEAKRRNEEKRVLRGKGMCICRGCGERKLRYDNVYNSSQKFGNLCVSCFLQRERKRANERRKNDAGFAAAQNARNQIALAIKNKGKIKSKKTEEIIGYPLRKIAEWAWRNGYNPPHTHIDHVRPVSYFLKLYPDDVNRALREAWQLSNLRVIPAKENLRKSAKREFLI